MHMLPSDTLVAYAGLPPRSGADNGRNLARILTLAEGARQLGLLPETGRILTDVASTLPLLAAYPHALALMDASTRQVGPESHRLDSLQAVLLLQTGDDVEPVLRHIRRFLLAYTNDQVSRIEPLQVEIHDTSPGAPVPLQFHQLTDRRWPSWLAVEWGPIGEVYVVGVGRGSWTRAAGSALGAEPALHDTAWFERAFAECRGEQARMQVYVNVAALTDRLNESSGGVAAMVRTELGLDLWDRRYWTVDQRERRVDIYHAGLFGGEYRFARLTNDDLPEVQGRSIVPGQAERYAAIRLHMGRTIESLVRAYLSARSPDVRTALADWWEDFQCRARVNVATDLLARFGDTTVLHTWPPHPLGLSLLSTALFEINGDPARFRAALDALLTTPSRPTIRPVTQPANGSFSSGWRKTADGIWFYQRGMFVVLGLTVHENWLVVSFSPEAVRDNIRALRSQPADAPQ